MTTTVAALTPIRRTQRLGVEFWNDSCRVSELEHAAAQGAAGATSNPVIVGAAVDAEPDTWLPFVAAQARKRARSTEDEVAWELIRAVAKAGAKVLAPLHRSSRGERGYLCLQVSPKLYRDPEAMAEQGKRLAKLGRNLAIKVPATEAGLEAMEELVASGVPVNATVSFTASQAIACAQAMEKGRKRAGRDVPGWVTLMVGRLDDHLKRVAERDKPGVDSAALDWAGIAVFKAARGVFARRKFRSRLLVAAYRHERHWTELVGPGIVQSIPYNWWTRFNASETEPEATLDRPVEPKVLQDLLRLPDFRRAYEPDGLKPAEFVRYGASTHTLEQFLSGYQKVLDVVRKQMLSL